MLEIAFIHRTKVASQYPGIFLFTSRSRMMRPVLNLKYNAIEMIGTLEQVYLNISINADEVIPEVMVSFVCLRKITSRMIKNFIVQGH